MVPDPGEPLPHANALLNWMSHCVTWPPPM
jgi:hypothetical protein